MSDISARSESSLKKSWEKLAWEFRGLKFLIRNLWYSRRLKDIPATTRGELSIRGMNASELPAVDQLQRQLRDGKGCNKWRRILYRIRGCRQVVVAVDGEQEVIGFQMFYFRADESKQQVIHSAFTGVQPLHQGHGIGTLIRKEALRSFSRSGLSAVSMHIREENQHSMKSAMRVGYRPVDRCSGGRKKLMMIRFSDQSDALINHPVSTK